MSPPLDPVSEADAAAYVDAAARAIGLPIDEAYRANVARQLAGILTVARLVTEFPLPAHVEPAPVFWP